MEFMNEYNSEINQPNHHALPTNQQLFGTDESEFDEFEHHLSHYANKDEELFNDDDSIMDHDGKLDDFKLQDEESQESQHQISLATSFCRNTQEPNDNFLDDNINAELLFDHFNEDRYIKCKYSEDLIFYEQQNLQSIRMQQNQLIPLVDESESDRQSINQNEQQDKHAEERSSEDERVIEKRKRHFLEFISTLPKVCTPSVCGTLSQKTMFSEDQIDGDHPDAKMNNQSAYLMGRLTEANEEILFEDDEFDEYDEENHKFDWSIDQLATLRPVDISFNERRLLRFKDFESDQLTQEKLTKENDQFFSQEAIAPSPNKRVSFKNIGQEFMNSECDISRHMINDKEQITFKGEDKDSGNYSNDEDNLEFTDHKMNSSNGNQISKQINNLDFSFNEHSNQRLSDIEFDIGYKRHQTNTPSRKSFGIKNKNNNQLNDWTTNLDFEPHSHLQTSTPCTSFSKFQQINAMSNLESNEEKLNREQSFNHPYNDQYNCKKSSQYNDDNLIFQSNQVDQKIKLPLQERNSMKQKKKLFHNFTLSNELITSSSNSLNSNFPNDSSTDNNSSSDNSSNNKSLSTGSTNDEGICESSKEITFGSSSSMSVCNNNSLTPKRTPKPKKLRNSIMKSFAQRLDEIELFANDENNSTKSNSPSANNDATNYTQTSKYHHVLTDSNCNGICKNFNMVLLNNSDSACYLSNGSSNSLNPPNLEMKRRALFN